MALLLKSLRACRTNESGQGLVEYAFILILVSTAAVLYWLR